MPANPNYEIDTFIVDNFPVFAEDGVALVSGLTQANFLDLVIINGNPAGKPVVINEAGNSGFYSISFTVDELGSWHISVRNDQNPDIWAGNYEVVPFPGGSTTQQVEVGIYKSMGLSASLNNENELEVVLWIDINGLRQADYEEMSAQIRDLTDTVIVDLGTQTSATAVNGFFSFTLSTDLLELDKAYVITGEALREERTEFFNTGLVRLLQ